MAYGDSGRKFWEVDLSTRAGARDAAHQGAIACFVFCGMAVLGVLFGIGLAGMSTPEGMAYVIGGTLETAVGLIAGFRLRAGKGAFWTMATAALAAAELVGKIFAFSIGGLIITGGVLVLMIQGIRGALALKNDRGFSDDVEVFD